MVVAAKDKECGTRPGASFAATGNGVGKCTWVALGDKARAEEESSPISKQPVRQTVVLLLICFKQQHSFERRVHRECRCSVAPYFCNG